MAIVKFSIAIQKNFSIFDISMADDYQSLRIFFEASPKVVIISVKHTIASQPKRDDRKEPTF